MGFSSFLITGWVVNSVSSDLSAFAKVEKIPKNMMKLWVYYYY